jgi:hypothetical protein
MPPSAPAEGGRVPAGRGRRPFSRLEPRAGGRLEPPATSFMHRAPRAITLTNREMASHRVATGHAPAVRRDADIRLDIQPGKQAVDEEVFPRCRARRFYRCRMAGGAGSSLSPMYRTNAASKIRMASMSYLRDRQPAAAKNVAPGTPTGLSVVMKGVSLAPWLMKNCFHCPARSGRRRDWSHRWPAHPGGAAATDFHLHATAPRDSIVQ